MGEPAECVDLAAAWAPKAPCGLLRKHLVATAVAAVISAEPALELPRVKVAPQVAPGLTKMVAAKAGGAGPRFGAGAAGENAEASAPVQH